VLLCRECASLCPVHRGLDAATSAAGEAAPGQSAGSAGGVTSPELQPVIAQLI
jgi:hypothetical protein